MKPKKVISDALKDKKSIDRETFEYIFKTNYRALCLHAENIVREKETAGDIVCDFFMILWEYRTKINIDTSLKAYLYKGIHNNCLKYLEHIDIQRKYTRNIIDSSDLLQIPDNNDPLSMLISQERQREIENAINALPAQCREVFVLAKLEELSYQEIAEQLGIAIGTVRTQITRAMTKLRESLENI